MDDSEQEKAARMQQQMMLAQATMGFLSALMGLIVVGFLFYLFFIAT